MGQRGAKERTEVAASWESALHEDGADGLPLFWLPLVVVEVRKGRQQWHCSGRGAALCRLSALRRAGGTPRVGPPRVCPPSVTARAFTSLLPLLTAALVTPDVLLALRAKNEPGPHKQEPTPARVPASAEEQDETNGEISETSRCASRLLLACASQATAVS